MKKLLLPLLFLFSISTTAFAQNISIGLRGGLAVGSAFGTGIIRTPEASRIGFTGGVFVNLPINSDFNISPELSYIQKGFTYNGISQYSDYVQFATTLKINMGDAPVYTIVGPFVSYLPTVNDLAPEQKSLEAGGIFGFGYRLNERLSLEGRYQFSNHIWESLNRERFRNTAIDFSLCYHF